MKKFDTQERNKVNPRSNKFFGRNELNIDKGLLIKQLDGINIHPHELLLTE